MLTIKLHRVGKKKQPVFRLIVTEKGRDPWGDNLEIVGWMNPRTKEKKLEVERIKHWLSKGAQTTDTIHNLLIEEKIIEGDPSDRSGRAGKRRSITISKVRQAKIDAAKPKAEEPVAEAPAETPKAE